MDRVLGHRLVVYVNFEAWLGLQGAEHLAERNAAKLAAGARRKKERAKKDPEAAAKSKVVNSATSAWTVSTDPYKHVLSHLRAARHDGKEYDSSDAAIAIMTELCKGPCFYCKYQPVLGVDPCCGLDRVDSALGYILGNLVGACFPCNRMKSDKSVAQFASVAKAISRAHPEARDCALSVPQREVDIASRRSRSKDYQKFDKLYAQLDPSVRRSFKKKLCYLCHGHHSTANPIGVDRLDNKLPYTNRPNLRPCCIRCNFMKNDAPLKMFLANIQRVTDHAKVFNV